MPAIDHNTDISIYTMVRNRLPFIEDTPTNTTLVSNFTLEIMWELEVCFQVGKQEDLPYDANRVGHEGNYTVLQQSIIADIVSVYILLIQGANGIGVVSGGGGPTPTLGTFLKRAKAGSTEIEYDQFDATSASAQTTFGLGVQGLLEKYHKSAVRRAAATGCYFDICGDCTIQFTSANTVAPFAISSPAPGCGCCGS